MKRRLKRTVRRFDKLVSLLIIVGLATFGETSSFSQSWNGPNDGEWNTASYWNTNSVPGSGNEAVVNNTANGILYSGYSLAYSTEQNVLSATLPLSLSSAWFLGLRCIRGGREICRRWRS